MPPVLRKRKADAVVDPDICQCGGPIITWRKELRIVPDRKPVAIRKAWKEVKWALCRVAANRARRNSEAKIAAKQQWEAVIQQTLWVPKRKWIREDWEWAVYPDKKQKLLAARYYQLKCGYAPTATYLKRLGLRDDDQCWWCGEAAQTREHFFRHCRR